MENDELQQIEEPSSQEDTQKYKEYCRTESDEAYTNITKNQEEYDKQLLVLSTALLGVLVAFLKDIVRLDSAIFLKLLYFGFLGLGLTIVFVMISFQMSIHALEKVREYFQEHFNGNINYPFPDAFSRYVKITNIAGGVAFIAGVLFSFLFVTINLAHQSGQRGRLNEVHSSTRGLYPEEPDLDRHGEPRGSYQIAHPTCPETKHCKFTFSSSEEIGAEMSKMTDSVANDGAPPKVPQMKVNGGQIPKKPINTGSKEKPKP